jgi:hypothetical protein
MVRRWSAAVLLLAGCATVPGAPAPAPPSPPEPPAAAAPAGPGPYPEPEALRSLFGADYDRALAAAGLDRRSARCSPEDMSVTAYGRFPTPLFEALMADPTLSDRYARVLREAAFASAGNLEASSMYAATRLGVIVRMGLLGDPLAGEVKEAEKPGALEKELAGLLAQDLPSPSAVPPRVLAAAALVVRAAKRANNWISRATKSRAVPLGFGDFRQTSAADATIVLSGRDEDSDLRHGYESTVEQFDLQYVARAAAELEIAIDRATQWLSAEKDLPPFSWRAETVLGVVLLRGGGDDSDSDHDGRHFLLRIDTGGNDLYESGAAASPAYPFSVLLDVSGNDTYKSRENEAAFGAGCFGVGLLVDLAGNDRYVLKGPRSLGLGAGVFGVGALLDAGGDDVYEGDGFCQGAGACGWGTLTDLGGTDRYSAYRFSQGFGFVQGAGVLTDLGGNDEYGLGQDGLRYPSAQSKEHNDSLGQGFGFGFRADYLDGHSLAGGVGILADREGDDVYRCGVFGQGAGYWMGVGMLLDGTGRDRYEGAWYVQGACAHFAVGLLEDAAGDDSYKATLNMAQGAGHDFSLGVLLDRAGNDTYRAPNLSLGGGNSDGMGICIDGGGDDAYDSRGITLGFAAVEAPPSAPTVRHGALTLGVFLDLGGKDSYAGDGKPWPFAGDGLLWRQAEREGKAPFSNVRGVGLDR